MAELAVVRRYARALFDTAQKGGQVDQVAEDLKGIDQAFSAVPRLAQVLRAPTVSGARKKALFQRTFARRVSPLTLRFIALVIDRRRESILADVYGEFIRLANEYRNILSVTVTSATPMTDAERDALSTSLQQRTGKTIALQVNIDETILGGLVLRMGDTVYDGSVRARLSQLRQRLQSGRAL